MKMVEAIATTSFIGCWPPCGSRALVDSGCRRTSIESSRLPMATFIGRKIGLNQCLCKKGSRSLIKAFAMELTKEAYSYKEKDGILRSWNYRNDSDTDLRPGVWPPNNKADNPSIHNPLLRLELMSCGWLGAIFEWEGVIIDDHPDLEKQAWLALSEEEGKSPPPAFLLNRIEGMKNEQAISEVLCWSRDPSKVRRLTSRKEEIYQELHLQVGIYRLRSGSREFVDVLMAYKIPMALVSTRPRKNLEAAIRDIGIEGVFSVIVAAEDVHRGKPDPEMFVYAAQTLKFIPERCIVFGNSNQTIEAAHDARMKCVAVASKHPVYELGAADLVVRHLDELSVVDLKNLAAVESPEFDEPELEMEEEIEDDPKSTRTGVDDSFW